MIRFASAFLIAGFAGACQPLTAPLPSALRAPASCASSDSGADDVKRTIEAFYVALSKDDATAFAAVTTDDFHAFELGKRFTGKALFDLIAQAHRDGRTYVWNVGSVDATIDCRIATAVWETNGSAGVPPKLEPRAWLESATLVREDGRWAIAFLHSTPKNPNP